MGEELSCGQAQNEVKFDSQVKFDLEDQNKRPDWMYSNNKKNNKKKKQ